MEKRIITIYTPPKKNSAFNKSFIIAQIKTVSEAPEKSV